MVQSQWMTEVSRKYDYCEISVLKVLRILYLSISLIFVMAANELQIHKLQALSSNSISPILTLVLDPLAYVVPLGPTFFPGPTFLLRHTKPIG